MGATPGDREEGQRKVAELAAAAEPLMKYLADNHHPHITAIVTSTNAELVEGQLQYVSDKFVRD